MSQPSGGWDAGQTLELGGERRAGRGVEIVSLEQTRSIFAAGEFGAFPNEGVAISLDLLVEMGRARE